MAERPIPLNYLPGIQRDGTALDSDRSLDALWTRWRLGRARKMRGYQQITGALNGVPRRIHMFYSGSQTIIHVGTSASLQQVIIDANGALISMADRTPQGFAAGPDVGWTLDAIFDTTSNVVQLVAHAVPDLETSASAMQTIPFIGQINSQLPLGEFSNPNAPSPGVYTQPKIAGGVVCVQPFVFDFDANGLVQWSAPNLPLYLGVTGGTSGAGQARISAQKIVSGMPLRGGGVNSPAALFWSLSEVITATYVGTPAWFAFNTVSPSSSILSTDCVIEYDGLYYWAGIDRFLCYNGTVIEVPNMQNLDWFFDNINWTYAGKCFAFKVPRFGEIWWCAPLFGNTEPSHAVIFNVRENCWYDTELPDGGRSAGYFAQGFRYPVMGGSSRGSAGYSLWMHETGTDQVVDDVPAPVRSYYETPYLAGTKANPASNRGWSIQGLEPDFIQSGDMSAWVVGTWNPKWPDFVASPTVPILQNPTTPQQQIPAFKTTLRLPRFHFESNTLGGTYISGRHIARVTDPEDDRFTGGSSAPTGTT